MILTSGIEHAFAGTFLLAAQRYWLTVFPQLRTELRGWRRRAWVIPDGTLRDVALQVQRSKASNIEGAAAFAAFAPGRHRRRVLRTQVCFQAIYDYVDSVAEDQTRAPMRNGRTLHLALRCALSLEQRTIDYYAHCDWREDGGYIQALVYSCRTAMMTLPSCEAVRPATVACAHRIVAYQSLNLGARQGSQRGLARWSAARAPAGSDLRWWEVAASAGSSLGAFALMMIAAHQNAETVEAQAVAQTYFPWVGSLHSLLDSLVDEGEDLATGQPNLLSHYEDRDQAADRIAAIASEAARRTAELPRASWHVVVLGGMVGSYLSEPQAATDQAQRVARRVLEAVGGAARPALAVFRLRRLAFAS